MAQGLQAALLEDHVIAALLAMACQGSAAPAHPEPLATRRLQRLEDYVLAHLDEPLTLRTLAEVAQTSVRSVQSWFAQARGTTPGAYIRARRLERVRHELLVEAMNALNERERHILTERRLTDEPKTLEELSQVYDVSRERIRQIEVRAFEKLQKALMNLAGERRLLTAA